MPANDPAIVGAPMFHATTLDTAKNNATDEIVFILVLELPGSATANTTPRLPALLPDHDSGKIGLVETESAGLLFLYHCG